MPKEKTPTQSDPSRARQILDSKLWNAMERTQSAARQAIAAAPAETRRICFLEHVGNWGQELGQIAVTLLKELSKQKTRDSAHAEVKAMLSEHLDRTSLTGATVIENWARYVCDNGAVSMLADESRWRAPLWLQPPSKRLPNPSGLYPATHTKATARIPLPYIGHRLSAEETRDVLLRLRLILFREIGTELESAEFSVVRDAQSVVDSDAQREDVANRNNAFYRSGDVWVVCYEGKPYYFQNTVGFQYIWVLLRHSGRELAAKQVLALCNAGAGRSISEPDLDADNLSTQDNLQERSDSRAIAQYKARAREIETESTKAKRNGEEAEVIRLRNELKQITELITKDRGVFGKRRKFSNDDERARSTVTTAIKRAREEMRKRSSEMANYFEEAISTGKDCIFRDAQTVWRLEQPTTTTKH